MNSRILFVLGLTFFASAEASQFRRAMQYSKGRKGVFGVMRGDDLPTTLSEDFKNAWRKIASSVQTTFSLSAEKKDKKQ